MIVRAVTAVLLLAAASFAAVSPAAANERGPRESYEQCKRRISAVPPCNKWTRECAQRCGFMY